MYTLINNNGSVDLVFKCTGHAEHSNTPMCACVAEVAEAISEIVEVPSGSSAIWERLARMVSGNRFSGNVGEISARMRFRVAEVEMYGIGIMFPYRGNSGSSIGGEQKSETDSFVSGLGGIQDRLAENIQPENEGLVQKVENKLGPNGGRSIGRGVNYERNQMNRERKKNFRKKKEEDHGSKVSYVGSFAGCDDDVRRRLQESRAKMFIAENEARAAKAESYVRHSELVKKSRVNESKFELDRQTVEDKLQKISAKRFGLIDDKGMPTGKVETVVSGSSLGSYSTPSITNGSVSPSSSISMQEVNEMKLRIETLSRSEAEARLELKKCNEAIRLLGAEIRSSNIVSGSAFLSKEAEAIRQFNSAYDYEIPESVGQDYSIPDSCY